MVVQQALEKQLRSSLQPEFLDVANESHQHSVPENSETHFRVVVVSDAFSGRSRVARHQQVYAAVAELLQGPIHALALHTYTPVEWLQRGADAPDSPQCLGGSKAEQG